MTCPQVSETPESLSARIVHMYVETIQLSFTGKTVQVKVSEVKMCTINL